MKIPSFIYASLTIRQEEPQVTMFMSSQSARDLLYQDQAQAMARRASYEELLLPKRIQPLTSPKARAGKGFGASKEVNRNSSIEDMKIALNKDGVIRVNNALSPDCTDRLLLYVLLQQQLAQAATEESADRAESYYGVETERKNRCDLQLSLLSESPTAHVVADTLQELIGTNGSLRSLYEELVTTDGEFYELASVITNPGSDRQQFHPDLPFRDELSPLYVIFLALQDVVDDMGPTAFLMGTHTRSFNKRFQDESEKDNIISTSECRLATLKKGDLCLFDARILHCGNANNSKKTRALFNLSFRNAANKQASLGYKGSMRPKYVGAMNFGDVTNALDKYEQGDTEPFASYGNGL